LRSTYLGCPGKYRDPRALRASARRAARYRGGAPSEIQVEE